MRAHSICQRRAGDSNLHLRHSFLNNFETGALRFFQRRKLNGIGIPPARQEHAHRFSRAKTQPIKPGFPSPPAHRTGLEFRHAIQPR
jgi:hypothetical protein